MSAEQEQKPIAQRLLRLVQWPFGFVFWWLDQLIARLDVKHLNKEWRWQANASDARQKR
jgi:hypothetical protein